MTSKDQADAKQICSSGQQRQSIVKGMNSGEGGVVKGNVLFSRKTCAITIKLRLRTQCKNIDK